jgi:hypothetical protein
MKLKTFRIHQLLRDGRMWRSSVTQTGDLSAARLEVMVGHCRGQPRAAVEEGTGVVIFAVDGDCRGTMEAVALFDGKKPRRKCTHCTRYFARFRCGAPIDCDCPKCLGYCECHEAAGEPA